jgi:hypothetical protein
VTDFDEQQGIAICLLERRFEEIAIDDLASTRAVPVTNQGTGDGRGR